MHNTLLVVTLLSCIFLQCRVALANYHPSDFVHGLLAAHAYETSSNGEKLLEKEQIFYDFLNVPNDQKEAVIGTLLDKWSVHEVITSDNNNNQSDYYGVIYKNDVDKQLVLAHRVTDLRGVYSDEAEFNLQFKETTRKVVDLVKASSGSTEFAKYAVSFTGHSLGAWLADLSVYYCHRFFHFANVKAVTFEAPGSETLIHTLEKSAAVDLTKLDIVSYLSQPTLLNSVSKHVGLSYLLNNTDVDKQLSWLEEAIELGASAAEDTTAGFSRLVNEQSLKFILEAFNHESGRPFVMQEIERWPSITLTSLSTDSNVNSVHSFVRLASEKVHLAELNVQIGKGALATMLTCAARASEQSETIQNFLHSAAKALALPPKSFDSTARADTDLFRMIVQSVAQNNYNISIVDGDSDVFFRVKEAAAIRFDERAIVDTVDESIRSLVHLIKSEVDASEKDYVLVKDIQYIRRFCRYDSSKRTLSVTKTDLMMQDIRDRAYRIGAKYPLRRLDEIRWSGELKKESILSNELLSVVSPGKFVEFDTPSYTQLDEMFNGANKSVLISGIGGVGKSTLALLYSRYRVWKDSNTFCVKSFVVPNADHLFQEYFDKWIDLFFAHDGDVQETLRKQVRSAERTDREIVNRQINAKLAHTNASFLFVFDAFDYDKANGTEFELLEMILRHLPTSVQVLITSRVSHAAFQDHNLLPFLTSVELAMLERDKADEFLRANLLDLIGNKNDTEQSSAQILDAIGGEQFLPFKLYLIVTFIRQSRAKESWQESLGKLVEKNFMIRDVVESIFHTVYAKSDGFRQVMHLVNLFDDDEINLDLLQEVIGFDQKKLKPVFAYMEREHLVTLKLLNAPSGSQVLAFPAQMRRYLQAFLSEKSKEKSILDEMRRYVKNLESYLRNNDITANANLVRALTKLNADAIDQASEEMCARLIFIGKTTTSAALKQFMYEETIKMGGRVLAKIANSETAAADVALIFNNVASAHKSLDNFEQAIGYYNESLSIYRTVYPSGTHLDIARTLNDIGTSYFKSENFYLARKNYADSLRMYEKIHHAANRNHPDIARTLNLLGTTLFKLGNSDRALSYYEDSLKIYEECYPDASNPDISKALSYLGFVYNNLGTFDRAIKYYEHLLRITRKMYQDENHPDIASALNDLGSAYQKSGNLERAIGFYEDSMRINEKCYPDGLHANVVKTLENLAPAYYNFGKYKESLACYEKIAEIKKRMSPDNRANNDIGNTINNIKGHLMLGLKNIFG